MKDSKCLGKKREEWFSTSPCHTYQELSSSSNKTMEEKILKQKKVNKALEICRDLSHKLYCEYKLSEPINVKARIKALIDAAMSMKEKHQWENSKKSVGHIDGIEVGDHFQYRNELVVIGLHQQLWGGIDFLDKGEHSLATSIVVSDKYDNVMKSGGCLVYEGQGSNPNVRTTAVPPCDQKLEGGNLALMNSMNARKPVRVIVKVPGKFNGMEEWKNNVSDYSYVYDGLYVVDDMFEERGQFGKLVFKFVLNKISDQPASASSRDVVKNQLASVSSRDVVKRKETLLKRQKRKGHVLDKEIVRINDISEGKEKYPIRVMTPISCVDKPKPFGYLVNMTYPKMNHSTLGGECNCENACVDSVKCVCIAKNNGGTIAYGSNKRLVSPMKSSFIYECGPSCACSLSCINRVSQCGIQFQLEIFKTNSKGWGVRTRSFIPSGSFVCELIGELVHQNNRKAVSNLHVDSYIFNIGGGGLIDASRHGNIGRFINHSCCPNLCMKDVMYDHNDKRLPHKMLFALKDIAAGREVSYDYNNWCKGNMKKALSNICYCGSLECNGYIYK